MSSPYFSTVQFYLEITFPTKNVFDPWYVIGGVLIFSGLFKVHRSAHSLMSTLLFTTGVSIKSTTVNKNLRCQICSLLLNFQMVTESSFYPYINISRYNPLSQRRLIVSFRAMSQRPPNQPRLKEGNKCLSCNRELKSSN